MSDYSDMSLADLFAAADKIGDKYLSDAEKAERDEALDAELDAIFELLDPELHLSPEDQ